MMQLTKFFVLKCSKGVFINRALSHKICVFRPITIKGKGIDGLLPSVRINTIPKSDHFPRCLCSKKDDSNKTTFNNNEANNNDAQSKGPIQRRIYKKPSSKYKLMTQGNLQKSSIKMHRPDLSSDKETESTEKILSPDATHQDSSPAEKHKIKHKLEDTKIDITMSEAKPLASLLGLKNTENLKEQILSFQEPTKNQNIPTGSTNRSPVHIEYVEKNSTEFMSTEEKIRELFDEVTGARTVTPISDVERVLNSSLDKDILTATDSVTSGDIDKLLNTPPSTPKNFRGKKRNRLHSAKKAKKPLINQTYKTYASRADDTKYKNHANHADDTKYNRLSPQTYAMIKNELNPKLGFRNRRRKPQKNLEDKQVPIMQTLNEGFASTDDGASKKSFHASANKNVAFKKDKSSDDGNNQHKETGSDGTNNTDDNSNVKKYLRALLYSLLTLGGSLSVYLSIDWLMEHMSSILEPFETMTAYRTALSTEETAFDPENPNIILTADELLKDEKFKREENVFVKDKK